MEELVDKKKGNRAFEKEKASLISEIKRVEGKLSIRALRIKRPQRLLPQRRKKGKKYSEMLKGRREPCGPKVI